MAGATNILRNALWNGREAFESVAIWSNLIPGK